MKDAAGKLIHRENHEVVRGSGSQSHPPRYGGTSRGYRVERRVGRPVRLVLRSEARLRVEAVQVALSSLYRASYLDIRKTDQSAAPNDSHTPVFRSITHLWIGPTGKILTSLEDVKCCQPICRGRCGFSLERQAGIMRYQVAEQEQSDPKNRMERGGLLRNQIGTVK